MNPTESARRAAEKRTAMLARLQPIKQESRAKLGELRATARALQGEAQETREVHRLTSSHSNDLFITPKDLAARMVDLAAIPPGSRVLEPSAGTGRIAEAIRDRGSTAYCVEINHDLAERLRGQGYPVHHGDFMTFDLDGPPYDAAIMNPPFSGGADIDHVMRAYDLTKQGGSVIAVMGAGAFFRGDKRATAFRHWLDEVGGYSEELPAGTFKQSGTGVNTRLVVIHKQGE